LGNTFPVSLQGHQPTWQCLVLHSYFTLFHVKQDDMYVTILTAS